MARVIWEHTFRLRRWESAKEWQKRNSYRKADDAMKRAGIENAEIRQKANAGGTR